MEEQLDIFIDQFYGKYSPENMPQGDRRVRLKEKLQQNFDEYVGQMYAKYAPDNAPDTNRMASLKSKYLGPLGSGKQGDAAGDLSMSTTDLIQQRYGGADRQIMAGISGVNRGFSQVVSAPLRFIGAGGNFLQSAVTGQDVDPNSGMFNVAAKAVEDFAEENFPRYEGVNETYQNVAEGLGQVAGMVLSSGTSAAPQLAQTGTRTATQVVGDVAADLGRKMATPTGFLGGTMVAAPEWVAAKEQGLSDEEAFSVLLKNYLVGQTEAIPIERMLTNLNRITGGTIAEGLKMMGTQGLTEAIQEGVQTYLTNEIAKDSYDPDRDPLFQVIEAAKTGGIVGLIAPGVMSMATNLPAEKRVKLERKITELQIDEEMPSSGDPQLDAEVDAIDLDPVDKQVLEEIKIAETIKEEQSEIEAEEKLQNELNEGTESTEIDEDLKNAENTAVESAENIPVSQTPEYKDAVAKVERLQKSFAELPIEDNADQLLFELREAREALRKIAGKPRDTRRKTDIQRQIEDVTGVTRPEKSVRMTPNEAIKHQVQTFYKGMDKGVRKGKKLADDLVSKVQEAIKEYPLTPKQTSTILTKVRNTNLYSPGSISRLNTFIDKVATDATFAENLSNAKDIRKQVRKRSKTKVESIPQNYKVVAREFAKINPDDLDNIDEYQAIATEVVAGFADPKSNQYAPINEERVIEYIDKINESQRAQELQRVREDFGFGDEVTDEELAILLDPSADVDPYQQNKDDARRKIARDKILRVAEYAKMSLDESERNKSLLAAPLEQLSDSQLIDYVRVVDNIAQNEDYSNTARIEAQIEAVNNAKKLTEVTKGTKKGGIGIIKDMFYNVPMMFEAIYSNSKLASKVQLYSGLEDVYNGGAQVEEAEHRVEQEFMDEAKRIKKKYGKSPLGGENQVRRGIFGAFVRYPVGANPQEAFNKSKEIIEESIRRIATKPGREDLAADAAKVYDRFKDAQSIDEVIDIMRKNYPQDYEMWQFWNSKFEREIKDDLARVSREIHNEEFVEEVNYTPKAFEVVDPASTANFTQDEWLPSAYRSDIPGKPKQAKTAIRATNSLPAGMALNLEFDNNMFRKYRESMYDIKTSKARLVFREFMKLDQAREILGGQENKNKIIDQYKKSEEIQRGIGRDYSNATRFMDELTGTLRTLGYTAALGSADQFVKQYVPVATNTLFQLGGDSGLFFSHIPDGAKNLFRMYTIGQRGRRLGGADRGEATKHKLQSAYRNKILKAMSGIHNLTEKGSQIFMYSLTQGDVSVAQRSWVAYYLKYLKDKGIDPKTVDLNTEHTRQNDPIRREAASFAEHKVKTTQVVSNPAELAKTLRTAPGAENWLKNIFIPFSTFAVNLKARMVENVRQLRTNPDKAEAYRALAGTVTEATLYSAIKYFVLSAAYNFLKRHLEELFGLEGEEEDDDDKAFRIKQWYSSIAKDLFPLSVGTAGENASMWMMNRLAHLMSSDDMTYADWKREVGEPFYTYQGDSGQSFDLGLYSVGLDRVQELVRDTQAGFTGEATVSNQWGEKDIILDEDQQRFFAFMSILDGVASLGLMDAGLYRLFEKIKREQLKSGGSTPGQAQQRPRPRPMPRPRPLPRPASNLQR